MLGHRADCQAVSCREAEELGQHQADALPQALAAWDAWVCAPRDGAADAAHLELRPPSADDAEKLAARERDGQARDAYRRLELRAELTAEPDAQAPYKRAVAQFAERSCAGLPVAEQPDASQSEPPVARSL